MRKHPQRVEQYLEHIAQASERVHEYVEPFARLGAFEQTAKCKTPLSATSKLLARPQTTFVENTLNLLRHILNCRGAKSGACVTE